MEAISYTFKSTLDNLDEFTHFPIKEISAYDPKNISPAGNYNYYDKTVFFDENSQILYLNINIVHDQPNYFKDIIKNILKNTISSEVVINYPNFTMLEIINTIIENPHIKKVIFPNYLSRFKLTAELLTKLKSHNITPYVPCFDSSIKKLLNHDFFLSTHFYETARYQKHHTAILYSPITSEDYPYLLNTTKISIKFFDIENTIQILTFLKNNNYQGKIEIYVFKNPDISLLELFANDLNIEIYDDLFDRSEYKKVSSLNEYSAIKSKLQTLLIPLRNSNLTPFEKYIFLYNLVKNYKKYKENNQNYAEARSIYSIIDNDYMVCSGYANLLTNLCEMVGIPCTYINCEVGKLSITTEEARETITQMFPNFLNSFITKHKSLYNAIEKLIKTYSRNTTFNKNGHARVYVNLYDPAYNIDGYYYSDPTWDSSKHFDYYTHLAFTDQENSQAITPFYFDYMALFDITTPTEFWEKLQHLEKDNSLNEIIRDLILIFISIDFAFFQKLCTNYGFSIHNFTPQEYSDTTKTAILTDICEHILLKVNKPISKEVKYTAIKNYLSKMNIIPNPLLDYYMYLLKYFNDLEDSKYFLEHSLNR